MRNKNKVDVKYGKQFSVNAILTDNNETTPHRGKIYPKLFIACELRNVSH